MNTFHLASLALLAGLISAAPTSTHRHVDAVVPEIEFADVDNAKYNLVTFTIDPAKKIQSVKSPNKGDDFVQSPNEGDDFVQWITKLAEMSYTCEKGTTVYSVYKGYWQVEKNKPDLENTYTIFEKFSDQDAANKHGTHIKNTAIFMWRTERDQFSATAKLALTVSNPTGTQFEGMMQAAVTTDNAVVEPKDKNLDATPLCDGYLKEKRSVAVKSSFRNAIKKTVHKIKAVKSLVGKKPVMKPGVKPAAVAGIFGGVKHLVRKP